MLFVKKWRRRQKRLHNKRRPELKIFTKIKISNRPVLPVVADQTYYKLQDWLKLLINTVNVVFFFAGLQRKSQFFKTCFKPKSHKSQHCSDLSVSLRTSTYVPTYCRAITINVEYLFILKITIQLIFIEFEEMAGIMLAAEK